MSYTIRKEGEACDSDKLFQHYEEYCVKHQLPIATPCQFKLTVSNVLQMPCFHTNVGGESRSFYPDITYVPDIPLKTIDTTSLPYEWVMLKNEDGVITLCRKSQFLLNGCHVTEEFSITKEGDIVLQIGPNPTNPADIGLPPNFHKTVMDIHNYVDVVSSTKVCCGKEVEENIANVKFTFADGQDYHGRKSSKCLGYVPLTSKGRVCPKCLSVSLAKLRTQFKEDNTPIPCEPIPQDSPDVAIDPDIIPNSAIEQYFPNCSNLLYQLILYQSKCLWNAKLGKDHRCHRWSKDLISFAVSVYISSPRTYRLIACVLSLPSESLIKNIKTIWTKTQVLTTTSSSGCTWRSKEQVVRKWAALFLMKCPFNLVFNSNQMGRDCQWPVLWILARTMLAHPLWVILIEQVRLPQLSCNSFFCRWMASDFPFPTYSAKEFLLVNYSRS